jgi:hypothetical protein
VPVDAAIVDMAACDAQHLGELLPHTAPPWTANGNANPDAAEGRSFDSAAEPYGNEIASTRQSSNHAHVGTGSRREKNTCTAPSCSTAPDAMPAKRAAASHPSPRAKQSIPPALRRAVLTRDRRRCRVPGCAHSTFVDLHHAQPRAEGGRNEASNLLTLCGAHHRATHRGELLIDREHGGSFTFRHADGAAYGNPSTPRLIDVHAKVFSALRHLGFHEGEVKTVLVELRGDAELGGATVERWLREGTLQNQTENPMKGRTPLGRGPAINRSSTRPSARAHLARSRRRGKRFRGRPRATGP